MGEQSKDRFDRASALFLRARGLGLAEREEFLARECAGDPELRRAVDALLKGEQKPMPFAQLADDLKGVHEKIIGDPAPDLPKGEDRVGPYRLLEKIGEGGFGTVYMAEQIEPVRRKVALKILKPGMDTRQVIARFEAERQALAIMDHPNITRVLDAGSTPSGRPYFVMELVKGMPINQYCDVNRLTTEQRLELFLPVCLAVHHAHQKGIIHRDLKPSNVLVTLHDGVPVPKVIDFGIAKALHGRLTDRTLFTEFRQFIGTPEYMSPEQAEMSGLDVDVRTDIYALGVLLYELLAGSTPLRDSLREASPADFQRIIRDIEPTTPSRHVGTLAAESRRSGTSSDIAERRRTDDVKLSRQLEGDLDWIVMKCLEKDRTRRYETADALLADLKRYRADEPVLAGPPSTLYRLSKFARRHRVLLAAASAVLIALITGLVFVLAAWREANRQRDAAMASMDDAKKSAARAGTVVGLLKDLLMVSDPLVKPDPSYTVWQALMDFGERQFARLEQEPDVEAELREVVGTALLSLGDLKGARTNLDRLVELRRSLAAAGRSDDETVARALDCVGRLEDALGNYSRAESLVLEGESLRVKPGANPSPGLGASSHLLAQILLHRGDAKQAEERVRRAIALRAHLDPNSDETLESRRLLAETLRTRGDFGGAKAELVDLIEILRRAKPGHPVLAAALNELGIVDALMGDPVAAEALHREALEIVRKALRPDHPDIIHTLRDLGSALAEQGRFGEAMKALNEALDLARQCYGPDHERVLGLIGELGAVAHAGGDRAAADRYLSDALDVVRRKPPENQSAFVIALKDLAKVRMERDRIDEAIRLLEEALDVTSKHPEVGGEDHADTESTLGAALLSIGKFAEAETHHRIAVTLLRTVETRDKHLVANSLSDLAADLLLLGRGAEALPYAREAFDVSGGENVMEMTLGEALLATGAAAEAEPHLKSAGDDFAKRLPQGHWLIGWAATARAEALLQLGRKDDAVSVVTDVAQPAVDGKLIREWRRAILRERCARVLEAAGRADLAAEWRRSS